MDLSALLLSRLQFAFTVAFHIIFPSLTIGLAAWLTVLEALHLTTGRPVYRSPFEFWLKIFGIAFGLGIVMAFEFGTNWSAFSRASGPIQGPSLAYETFTAFALEASFFGVLLFGRQRVAPWFYLFSTAMVGLGATFSAFMFWGAGLFVFPLMLLYTATNYSVFRGRIRPDADHDR
jgi:cytochrome bd ubiquinol oxidase subunit I